MPSLADIRVFEHGRWWISFNFPVKRNKRNLKHGLSGSRAYEAYHSAKQRCENPKATNYKNYGARGILFLWPSFDVFFAEMGNPPPGMSLDRKNNNGHYESGNCRWATILEQRNNRRDNRILAAFGRTKTINQWARELKMYHTTITSRLTRGWSDEQALSVPVRPLLRRTARAQPEEPVGAGGYVERRVGGSWRRE
jgi:hypothetical protein